MRPSLIGIGAAVVVLGAGAGVAIAASPGSVITQARLERSVSTSFANVYTQEARLLGHTGVSPASLGIRMMCDKGPGVPQSGPGTTWNCLTSWKDPNVPMPSSGYGKLEVTVHTNGCYTVGAPSSLLGYQTITDARGRTVNNPAYEFDGCLDPGTDNTPTGVTFPSALTLTNTTAAVDAQGRTSVDLACAVGHGGCVGTVTATAGRTSLGSASFDLTEQATTHLVLPTPVPSDAKQVNFVVKATAGIAAPPTLLPIQR